MGNILDLSRTGLAASMSSRDIADLVGSRHDNVKHSIERLVDKQVIQLPALQEVKNHLGQHVVEYVFSGDKGKRDSIVVVAQLSPDFTAKLVDRWQELEGGQNKVPMTYSQALRAAADRAEENERLLLKIEMDAPKVRLAQALIADSKEFGLTEAFKHLDIKPKSGFEMLNSLGWIFKRPQYDYARKSNWQPSQRAIEKGLLILKQRPDQNGFLRDQIFVTSKGLVEIRKLIDE
jgi:phage regulator Rha-like protein